MPDEHTVQAAPFPLTIEGRLARLEAIIADQQARIETVERTTGAHVAALQTKIQELLKQVKGVS